MPMRTPATPAQQPAPDAWHRGDSGGPRQPKTPRRLATYAWWVLVAWPVIFVLGVIPMMVLYPEGEGVSHGLVVDVLAQAIGVTLLCVPPLVAFVLSSIAFRRERTRWFLILPTVLVLLLAGWGYLARSQSGTWWGMVAAVVAAAALAGVALWPRRVGGAAPGTRHRAPPSAPPTESV